MKGNYLKEFVALRQNLEQERAEIRQRLQEIDAALAAGPSAGGFISAPEPAASPARAKSAGGGAKSGRRRFSPAARARIAAAARERWAKAKASGRNKL